MSRISIKILLACAIPLTVALIIAGGCSPTPVDPPTYSGNNGLVLSNITFTMVDNTTRTYETLVMTFGRSSMEYIDANEIQRGILMGDYVLERRDVELLLALPSNAKTPGAYVWLDGEAPTTTEAYAVLKRDEVEYTSVRGKTVITKFGGVGETVEGTFHGYLRHPETRVESEVDGRFVAQRIH